MRLFSQEESDKHTRRPWSYTPHRAIIALGAVLILVAAAGGTIGVVNSARAERSAAILTDRYLVLQPPVRNLRASVADFQVTAEQAFSGSAINAALLAHAVQQSTVTDQAYLVVQHLLSLPVNSTLAPGLADLQAAYVSSRTGLASLLAAGTPSQSAQVAIDERAADKNLDGALATLQQDTTDRLVATANQARAAAGTASDGLLLSLAIGISFGVVITSVVAGKALRAERERADHDAIQYLLTERSQFEGRLQRALEMAKAEPAVFDLVAQALGETAPSVRSEFLLADSSRAHFRQVLVTPADTAEAGCRVVSPDDCPAASRGQTMVFPISTAMDACPKLRGRDCSALCVPVSIGGNSVGVVHVTGPDGCPPSDAIRRDVEVVATRASERLAMLRAFELSLTQANSDSLTGLLTRRSLESRIRDLQDTGVQYAVAYGDLDHFKQVNDVFGHDAGDRALRTFAQILRDGLRPTDLPCRYGGEEFVVVLPSCRVQEAVAVLERVREHLAVRLTSGQIPSFTVSFGVASSEQASDFERTVALADQALLHAKAMGRDRIVVAEQGLGLDSDGPADSAPPLILVTPS